MRCSNTVSYVSMVMEMLVCEANIPVTGKWTGNVYPPCLDMNPSVLVSRISTSLCNDIIIMYPALFGALWLLQCCTNYGKRYPADDSRCYFGS
jgi:hypothetical protein